MSSVTSQQYGSRVVQNLCEIKSFSSCFPFGLVVGPNSGLLRSILERLHEEFDRLGDGAEGGTFPSFLVGALTGGRQIVGLSSGGGVETAGAGVGMMARVLRCFLPLPRVVVSIVLSTVSCSFN